MSSVGVCWLTAYVCPFWSLWLFSLARGHNLSSLNLKAIYGLCLICTHTVNFSIAVLKISMKVYVSNLHVHAVHIVVSGFIAKYFLVLLLF